MAVENENRQLVFQKKLQTFKTERQTEFEQWKKELGNLEPKETMPLKMICMRSLIKTIVNSDHLYRETQTYSRFQFRSLRLNDVNLNGSSYIKSLELPLELERYLLQNFKILIQETIECLEQESVIKENFKQILQNVMWNRFSMIDNLKIATFNSFADLHRAYIKATLFCWEDQVCEAWNKMSPHNRQFFESRTVYDSQSTLLVYFWTFKITNQIFDYDHVGTFQPIVAKYRKYGLNFVMLAASFQTYNVYGVKYFWNKINEDNHELAIQVLCETYEYDNSHFVVCSFFNIHRSTVNVILFVWQHVSLEKKMEIIYRCFKKTILNMWMVPEYHGLLKIAMDLYIPFMTESEYRSFMLQLGASRKYYTPEEPGTLLMKIWHRSPDRLRSSVSLEERCRLFTAQAATGKRLKSKRRKGLCSS